MNRVTKIVSILLAATFASQQFVWAAPSSLRPLAAGEGKPLATEEKAGGYEAHLLGVLNLLHIIQTGNEGQQKEASGKLVRLQEEQEGQKSDGRFITPIEIIIGHLKDKRFYPDSKEGMVKFFLDPRLGSSFRQRVIIFLISFEDSKKEENHQALHIPMKWIFHDVLVSMCKEACALPMSHSEVLYNLRGYLNEIVREGPRQKDSARRGRKKWHTKKQHAKPRTKEQSEIAKEMLNRIEDENWAGTISSCRLTRHMMVPYFDVLYKNRYHVTLQAFYNKNPEHRREPVVSNILAGVTLHLLGQEKGGVTMDEANSILKLYLGPYREDEADDLLSSLKRHLSLAGALPQSPTLQDSAREELLRSILRPLAAGEGRAPIPSEDELFKDIGGNWDVSIKEREKVNPDAVKLAFGETLTSDEVRNFVKALQSFKHPEYVYLASDEKLYGRTFWYSKETNTLYFARQAFRKIEPSEIIELLGHLRRAINSGHPDSAFIRRLSWASGKWVQKERERRARVAAPASVATAAVTPSVTPTIKPSTLKESDLTVSTTDTSVSDSTKVAATPVVTPSTSTETDEAISETEPALPDSAKAAIPRVATSPLKELLYEMLDPGSIDSRPVVEWIELKDKLRGYFEKGMSSFGIIFHKRPAVEIEAYKMALDGTGIAWSEAEHKEDDSHAFLKKERRLKRGIRAGGKRALVGEALKGLRERREQYEKDVRKLIYDYATLASALLKALVSIGLDADLSEETTVPVFIDNTLDWRAYWDAIRARYITESRELNYAYIPGHPALGFVTLEDEEGADVHSPISPKPILAARQMGFEPRVLSFPDIAEQIASDNIASVEYIAPDGGNPPALVINFKKEVVIPAVPGESMRIPSIAVLVLKEEWGRFPDGGVEQDLQKIESDPARVQALAFDKKADPQDRLDKTKALFGLSMANMLVARCGWQIESEEGARRAAEFFDRSADEKKAIYLQLIVWLKFSLIDNTAADKSRAKLHDAEGTKKEFEKTFDAHCKEVEKTIAQFKKRVLDEDMTDEQREAKRLLNFSPQVQEVLRDDSNRQIKRFLDAIAKGELPEGQRAITSAKVISEKLTGLSPWYKSVVKLAEAIAQKRERQPPLPQSPTLQDSARSGLEHSI